MTKPKAKSSVSRSAATPYSSKIIKAGALISDTKTLLAHWHPSETVAENTARLRRENVFGKSSRSRAEDIVAIFRQRYMDEPSVTSALARLAQSRLPSAVLDRLLYFHAARSDSLLFDTVVEILQPMHDKGIGTVELPEVHKHLSKWVEQGKTSGHWSSATVTRIAQGLLATLRDFGVLEGAVKKRITPPFLPDQACAYIAFFLNQHQPSGAKLIEQREWQLFFLKPEVVERLLFEAHQRDLLEYHVAGTVTRLTFPAKTLEEYADVIAQRTH